MLYLALFLSFFIGSIPFGVLIGKMRGIDVRAVGSGNIGATNVWRVLGRGPGTAAFVLDVLKGVAGALLGRWLVPHTVAGHDLDIALCSVAAVLGHIFSPFLGFKGGKGIATSLGALLGLVPLVGLIDFALWGVVLALTRTVSIASIASCIALPVLAMAFHAPLPHIVVASLMGLLAFIKHIPNLKRILAGTEPKIGRKKIEEPLTPAV